MTNNDPEILVLSNAVAVATEAAQRIAALSQQAISEKESFTLALSGGSTPKSLYLLLADEPFRSQINWELTELYWGDERAVPPEHADSNFRMVQHSLLQFVPIPPANIHRIAAELPPHDAADRYNHLLKTRFSGEEGKITRTFDLTILGLGEDAHTASLFPHSAALQDTEHMAVAVSTETLGWRITLTPKAINCSRTVMFLVTGSEKLEAVWKTFRLKPNSQEIPAQLVAPHDGKVIWLIDRAAAVLL